MIEAVKNDPNDYLGPPRFDLVSWSNQKQKFKPEPKLFMHVV